MKKLLFVLLVLSVTVNAQVPSYVPTNGLVAYYPFNGNANDASGNGNNGTVYGASMTSDRFGITNSSYTFNGSSNYIDANINQSNSFSVSVWFKLNSLNTANQSIVQHKSNCSRGGGYIIGVSSGKLRWVIQNCGNCPSQCLSPYFEDHGNIMNIDTNQWYHITIVSDGISKQFLYVNSVKKDSIINSNAITNYGNVPFSIAKWHDSPDLYYTNGKLDDIAIYNRALTQQEITQLYTGQEIPSYLPTNGLVGYWPFNGNANDASGNGNNGTVNGATLTTDRFGNVGKAYSFDGVNDYIETPHSSTLLFSQNEVSISTWISVSNWPQLNQIENYFLSKQSSLGNNQVGFHSYIFSGTTSTPVKAITNRYKNGSSSTFGSVSIINNNLGSGVWYNIIYTHNNSFDKIYIDGILVDSQNSVQLGGTNTAPLIFGCLNNYLGNFNGKIDDIAIYNRALTQSEITQLYNSNSCIANITNNDTTICRGSSVTLNAAAVNSASVTDINGNVYPTVNIGAQTWMQKNLNVSKYKNGDIIPQVTNATQWAALTTGAWCWYNNDSATYAATYGKLYNWYAVNDPRGLAPEGWHMPSDGEWNKLVKFLDLNADTSGVFLQSNLAGGTLKEAGLLNWSSPNIGATNISGFSGLPGGYRDNLGQYNSLRFLGLWWSNFAFNSSNSYKRGVGYNDSGFGRDYFGNTCGFSVRALRNTPTYLWSTGATTPSITVSPTVTTKYYCTVSDGVNTCKDSVTVTVSTITTNLITADTLKVCGTSTTISATTGLTSYAWSNGANTASTTVTSSGWYKCTTTNGACTAVDSVYVSLFNPKITQNDTTVCAGTPLTLTVNNNTALTSSLPNNLRNGLVGYWPFNGNANDESGNGNNGTVNGANLTFDRNGIFNSAYSFNNNEIKVNIPNSLFSSNFTISTWIYLDSSSSNTNYPTFITEQNSYLTFQIEIWPIGATPKVNFYFLNNYQMPGLQVEDGHVQANVYFNKWINLTLVNSNGINKLFLNSNLISTSQTSSVLQGVGNGSYLKFGNGDLLPIELFVGKMDDISIYNRALSSTEVLQLYNGNSYLWSTTATTPTITVTPTATTSYIATVSNGINTCKDTVKITVTNITSLSPTTIFGALDVCSAIGADTASVPVNYKINKIANAASYVWTVPAGATLLSGQGDTSIFVRFRSSFVSGAITVKSVSTCNVSSAVKSVTVYKRVAAAPTAIQKEFSPTSIVAVTNVTGSVSQIYRIKKVLYATSYNWYLNRGTNASITHINAAGVNDTAVIVTFASCFVKDTLSVKSVTPCSISTAKTVVMSASTTPATVSVIGTQAGDFAVCIGSSKSFTAIPNTPSATQTAIAKYRWTVPANSIITSATTDSATITVSFNTGFTGGSLSVKGISSCNVVGTTATTSVLQFLPPTPASIGSSTNSYNACINSSVTYTAIVGTATTAQAPAASFRWTRPNNTTITSASADSSSITVRFNTGYTGGVISVKSQSRCGTLSAARSQSLTHTGCALGTKLSQPITTSYNNSFEVSLYPNPTANAFKLLIKNNKVAGTISSTSAIVKVIDIQGRMIKSFQANTNQVIAIGNELKPGVYMVEVRVGEEVKVVRAVKF